MIVWLASYPKSGNTWLRKFLQAYIAGPPFRLNQFHPFFRSDIPPHEFQRVSRIPITELSFSDSLLLRHAVLWNLLKEVDDQRLFVKTHFGLSSQARIEFIPHCISEGAIYIIRDPRDVALSYAHHYGYDVDTAIEQIHNTTNTIFDEARPCLMHGIGDWPGHVETWTTRDYPLPRYVVKYEDMLRKPHRTFRNILTYLGEPYDQQRFNFALRATRFKNMKAQEAERGFAEQSRKNDRFFRSGKAGDWKGRLTDKQVARIEAGCRPMMEKFGYV